MKVADLVYEKILPFFTKDIKLVEVEYIKKNDGMHLVVYIDKENGVTVEDCVEISHMIDQPIEDLNPTQDAPYFLDISSYGLDKPLKYDWQFKKYENRQVDVKLYRKVNDRKEFTAILKQKTENEVVFELNQANFSVNIKDVAHILPHLEF